MRLITSKNGETEVEEPEEVQSGRRKGALPLRFAALVVSSSLRDPRRIRISGELIDVECIFSSCVAPRALHLSLCIARSLPALFFHSHIFMAPFIVFYFP